MRRPPELLAVALLVWGAATLLWVHRIHGDRPLAHNAVLQADTFRYFHPSTVYLHRELRSGRLPLWNPYQLAGQPYLALHVPAVLYPPNLLFAASLSPVRALEAHAIFHLGVAGLFAWLFARRLGLGQPARLAAAAGYMFATPLFMGVYMPPFLSTPVWLPAILWALHGLLEERRGRWAVGLASFVALAFLGGHTQALVYMLEFALLYGIAGLVFIARGHTLRTMGLVTLSGLLALGFVAPQLLPAVELAREAVRGLEGVDFRQAALSYVTADVLLEGLLRPFGPAPESLMPGPLRWLVILPPFALPLIACGLLVPGQRWHVVVFGAAAAGVGLLMLGVKGPLFAGYFTLPLGNLFRQPGRMAFLYAFLASVLVAMGIEGLSRLLGTSNRGRPFAAAAAYLLALGVAADFYARSSSLDHAHPAVAPVTRGAEPALIEHLASDPHRGRLFIENFSFYSLGSLHKVGMMNGIFAVPDYEPSMPAAYRAYFGVPETPPFQGLLYAVAAGDERRSRRLVSAERLDLMSVRYYAIRRPGPPPIVRGLREFAGGPSRKFGAMELTERPQALPRVYTVRDVTRVPDLDAALRRLDEDTFRPQVEAVVIEPAGTLPVVRDPPAADAQDRARIARYEPSEVVVEAECGAACLLVLTDLHYPGWRAEVDGSERPILRTNGIFRGVSLAPGEHRVVYRFAPLSFRVGVGMFVVAALAAGPVWRRA